MFRDIHDPAVAASLIRFIEELIRDGNLERAAKAAGIDAGTASRFLDSVRNELARARHTAAPAAGKAGALKLTAISDGAARGNPGEAACAVIFYDESGEELLRRSKRLGVLTNNAAEYHGVLLALDLATQLGARDLTLKLDSELVVRQLNGVYRVKHPDLKRLHAEARRLIEGLGRVEVTHVPRAETREVDKQANAELDGKT